MILAVDLSNPLFWAVFIGWILSVVLHEFAHGVVAYLGGDYTIRERGGLTLNPLQYVDPVMSLLLPAIFLAMGGIPLPGGATYVRKDLLRNRAWASAVALAGPTMNFLLFALLSLALNPRMGWIDPVAAPMDWTPTQRLVGALAFLQLFAVLLNLVPVPPLDGFQAISPMLPAEVRSKVERGPVALGLFVLFFLMIQSPRVFVAAYAIMRPVVHAFGLSLDDLVSAARLVLYNHT